jgi:hypothetical protein
MKSSLIGNPDYVIMDRSSIDTNSFDHFDFIFIDGDPNLLPWMLKAKGIMKVFKMAKHSNKCTFAAGIGMILLSYYCATNLTELDVINGSGKGTPLEKIYGYSKERSISYNRNQVFLDQETGDIYEFHKDVEKWVPISNAGFH